LGGLNGHSIRGTVRVKFINQQGLDEAGIDQDGVEYFISIIKIKKVETGEKHQKSKITHKKKKHKNLAEKIKFEPCFLPVSVKFSAMYCDISNL
jgi:ubiquitin-protein ligase E3 B